MAIKSIDLENFKGRTAFYTLGKTTTVCGRNGSGKSSIRDATAFLFCGTDSYGSRNPTHLISKDKDLMKVTIVTDKATLSRTLTRKGSSTIRVDNSLGVSNTYNQTQFEQLVGKPDVFLSAMIPGYLFDLTESKRQEVLAEVLPKVDRTALLAEILGFELTPEEKLKYALNRRPDLVAASVGQDRRSAQSVTDTKRGRIEQLSTVTKPELPNLKDRSSDIAMIEVLKSEWSAYDLAYKAFTDNQSARDRIGKENEYKKRNKEELLATLNTLVLKPKPSSAQIDLTELQTSLKPTPIAPVSHKIVESDNCFTCGQPVSPRYKDQMRTANEEAKAEWLKEFASVEAFNKEIRQKISEANIENARVKKEYEDVVESNRRVEATKRSLELQLSSIVESEIPLEKVEPVAPSNPYDRTAHVALMDENDNYKRALAVYDHSLKEWETVDKQIETLNKELILLDTSIARLITIETALKNLPEIENKRQIGVFNTESLLFDGNSAMLDGVPLKMLSTGERLSVYEYFCREITLIMEKPHGLIFIDDKDLISEGTLERVTPKAWDSSKFQSVYIYVKDSDLAVDIM